MIMDPKVPSLGVSYPFTGRWLVQNSPADRVPSHGTTMFASAFAIDFVPVDKTGRSAPYAVTSFFRPESPDSFPGFGRPVLAPIGGVVVGTHHTAADHVTYRGLPSVRYALSQRSRIGGSWISAAGNHVLIESSGFVVAICHLKRDSLAVRLGQRLHTGELLGLCGNSGNSTEPHVHLQAMDGREPGSARAVRLSFSDGLPSNGTVIDV